MYNAENFHKSFRSKSPIYYDVYQYLRTQRPGLDEQCLKVRKSLFEGSLNLESHYDRACKLCKARMDVAVAWWAEKSAELTERYSERFADDLKWEQIKDRIAALHTDEKTWGTELVELHEIVALMKFVYIELQWPLLLNNAILNKVFFEELLTEKLGAMTVETGIDLLELLTLLDNSTEHRYIPLSQSTSEDDDMKARLGGAADDFMALAHKFSLQKRSERRFNQTFEYWSPMVIDIRDAIGCYLESFGLCKRQELAYMPIYNLLPLLDDTYLPELYMR